MLWQDIPDLENIKRHLVQLHQQNQLPHAILFKGEQGNAVLPTVLGFMQYLYCDHPQNNYPCGLCKSCKQTKNLYYPEFKFILPHFSSAKNDQSEEADMFKTFYRLIFDNIFLSFDDVLKEVKGKNKQAFIFADDVHQMIESVSYSAVGNKYKIICIWTPEMMNTIAANKLLKTLEEPTPQTLFFLVTSKPDELLPTILSRVQQITIPNFSNQDIIDYLVAKYDVQPNRAQEIAQASNGNINKAIHILNYFDEYEELLNDFRELARLSIKYDYDGIDKWMSKYENAGREALKKFLEYTLNVFHYSLLKDYELEHLIKTIQIEREFISRVHPYVHQNNIPKLYEIFNDAYHHATRNANMRILLNNLFLRCNEVLKKKNNTQHV